MDKIVILFTMEGCQFCGIMKQKLKESNINFYERDIDEHEDEYQMFVEITENEMVPAFMIIEGGENKEPISSLYAPERDFNDLDEGVQIIKDKLLI